MYTLHYIMDYCYRYFTGQDDFWFGSVQKYVETEVYL